MRYFIWATGFYVESATHTLNSFGFQVAVTEDTFNVFQSLRFVSASGPLAFNADFATKANDYGIVFRGVSLLFLVDTWRSGGSGFNVYAGKTRFGN